MFAWLKQTPRPVRASLLAAVPVRNQLARVTRPARQGAASLSAATLRLTAPLAAGRLHRMLAGRRSMPEKSFDLDELGAFVWESIDGRRHVEDLIRRFAGEKRVNLREAEVAVLAFLKTLAQRNLIALAVSEPGAGATKTAPRRSRNRRA